MTNFRDIAVISSLDLDDDQKRRVRDMVYGRNHFDHRGQFETRDARVCDVAKIHLLDTPHEDVPGGHSNLEGVDDLRFSDTAFIYLETPSGEMIGWNDARAAVKSEHVMGMIFADDTGQGWLETWDHSGEPDPARPLRRISLETASTIDSDPEFIRENLPADGEFLVSCEDLPVITSIPWWGPTQEQTVIEAAKARLPEAESETLAPEA